MVDQSDVDAAKQVYRDKPKSADGRMSGSTSYLQRMLHWTYNRASGVVETLEAEGFLTPPDRNGMRFVVEK